jgi:hypothetical protein
MIFNGFLVCKCSFLAFPRANAQSLQRMKQHRVYFLAILMVASLTFISTGCARKSGCAAIESTVKTKVKKNGQPKKKASSGLFDKKTRRKMN